MQQLEGNPRYPSVDGYAECLTISFLIKLSIWDVVVPWTMNGLIYSRTFFVIWQVDLINAICSSVLIWMVLGGLLIGWFNAYGGLMMDEGI